MRYMELNLVKPTATPEGIQDHVAIEENDDGGVIEYRGNIGVTVGPKKQRAIFHEPGEFDSLLERFLSRGFYIVPDKKAPSGKKVIKKTKGSGEYAPERSKAAEVFINLLRSLANKDVAETFTFSVDELTDAQIKEGRALLNHLAAEYMNMSLKEFNQEICHYYSIIPRRMKRVSDYVARGKDKRGRKLSEEDALQERADILTREKERFDTMVDLLTYEQKKSDLEGKQKTVSEAYGLEIRDVTEEEEKYIRKMLGSLGDRYKRAWHVNNKRTEAAFNKFCEKEGLTEGNGIDHLFHGSRGANFWSIITNGLTVNPQGVPITGKAYGIGTYFAPSANKSIGYTDRIGAKYTGGQSDSGLLGIYKVATGNRYPGTYGCDYELNWEKLQKIQPGAHCTWAEARYSGFLMDEVIVYLDQQSTITFLVEIAA